MTLSSRLLTKVANVMLVVLLAGFISFLFSGQAANASEKKSYNEISKEYNLKVVTEVPEGVQPIEVKSEEELEKLLKEIKASAEKHAKKDKTPIVIETSEVKDSGISTLSTTTTTYTVDSYKVGVAGTVALYAKVSNDGYRITYVNEYTKFTGFTWGFEWNEVDSDYSITSGGKDVYVWSEGELEYYLLIDGLIKVYTQDISLDGYLTILH